VPHHCVTHGGGNGTVGTRASCHNYTATHATPIGSGFVCGSIGEAVTQGSIFERGSLALNTVTFLCILLFYVVEFRREQWCMTELVRVLESLS